MLSTAGTPMPQRYACMYAARVALPLIVFQFASREALSPRIQRVARRITGNVQPADHQWGVNEPETFKICRHKVATDSFRWCGSWL